VVPSRRYKTAAKSLVAGGHRDGDAPARHLLTSQRSAMNAIRVWIDGTLAIDAWDGARIAGRLRTTTAGKHDLRVELPAGGWLGRARLDIIRGQRGALDPRAALASCTTLCPIARARARRTRVSLKHDDRMPVTGQR